MPIALIVDDQTENRYLLECLLSAHGFRVVTAANGREALDRAAEQPPHLIVSDILMPVMDGFALCRAWKLSDRLKGIPFIFYTATYTDPQDEQFALSLGADYFLVKPIEPDTLIRLIRQALSHAGASETAQASATAQPPDEAPYLRQYNEVLIRKLEDKLGELEKANQRLTTTQFAIDSSRAGIAMANLSGQFTYANPAFERLWGISSGTLSDLNTSILFPTTEEYRRAMRQVDDDSHWTGTVQRTRNRIDTIVMHMGIHTVRNNLGLPICFMIKCFDITEQERMRLDLQRTQRLESLNQFAAGIAHDLNNLLTIVYSGLGLAELETRDLAPHTPGAYALKAFTRARDLSQRLLNFGKAGTPQRRVVALEPIIRDSYQLALSGSGTRLQLDISPSLLNVHANPTELSQVFCNLIINARQAMGDTGTLKIVAENGSIQATQDPVVKIRFIDDGPGIAPEVIHRVFEPYFTSKADGSGLGLAMCRAIVTHHHGQISVQSTQGAGATFEITLPASSQLAETTPHYDTRSAMGSGRVLWMDDNEQLCRLTAALLTKQGYQVEVAGTGDEAISKYEDAVANATPFDLIVLDLTVQGGRGGFETLLELRERYPEVKALACSGYSDEETLVKVKEAGFRGLIAKPFLAHELYGALQDAMSAQVRGS